jgi:hypothetical protein
MKAFNGFILTKYEDPDTGEVKMVPYFPIVDSADIINTTPVQADEKLTMMSERWTLAEGIDGIDKTSYIFTCKYSGYSGTEDADTLEQIGSSFLDAEVHYDLHRSGKLEVWGIIRLNGQKASFDDTRDLYLKTFYLPFSIPDNVPVRTSYAFGPVEGLSLVSSLSTIMVTNKNLNPTNSKKKYYAKLDIKQVVEKEAGVLDLFYRSADASYSAYTYESYVDKYLPIRFDINGLTWK